MDLALQREDQASLVGFERELELAAGVHDVVGEPSHVAVYLEVRPGADDLLGPNARRRLVARRLEVAQGLEGSSGRHRIGGVDEDEGSRTAARVVPLLVEHAASSLGEATEIPGAHVPLDAVQRVIVIHRALKDVEETFVEPMRMVADPHVRIEDAVVHHDQRADLLHLDERADPFVRDQALHAEIVLVQHGDVRRRQDQRVERSLHGIGPLGPAASTIAAVPRSRHPGDVGSTGSADRRRPTTQGKRTTSVHP